MPFSIQSVMNFIRASKSTTQDAKGFREGYAFKWQIMQFISACDDKLTHQNKEITVNMYRYNISSRNWFLYNLGEVWFNTLLYVLISL